MTWPPPPPVRFLTAREVAAIRRKTENALTQERKRGEGPPYIQDRRRILYPATELERWLNARHVQSSG